MNLLIIPLAFFILLLMGFEALDIVPSLLFSECVNGITATLAHHRKQNVDFRSSSRDTRVALVLACCVVAGTIAGGAMLAVRLPHRVLQVWIGILVLVTGLLILEAFNRMFRFTW